MFNQNIEHSRKHSNFFFKKYFKLNNYQRNSLRYQMFLMLLKRLRASYLCDAVKLIQTSKNFLSVLPLNSVLDRICAGSFRGKGARWL